MLIQFELLSEDSDELRLIDKFCSLLSESIGAEILKNIPHEKIYKYNKFLLESNIIDWKVKPNRVDTVNMVKFIVNNIVWFKRKGNRYIIKFKDIYYPNTNNSIFQLARFIDMGNETYQGLHFISPILLKYRDNLNLYWKSYVSINLHKLEVGEVVVIR